MRFENVYRITQWGYGEGAKPISMYLFAAPNGVVAKKAIMFRRTPKQKKGYQRELSPRRLKRSKQGIAGYVLDQMGVFPTSVLVNVRKSDGTLEFKKKGKIEENIEFGDLIVPDNAKWYIVDGQHRIEGLKIAMREENGLVNYPLAVTMTNENIFYEMLIFYIVNSRAKPVKSDLVYRILQTSFYEKQAPKWIEEAMLTRGDKRKAVAAMIVDLLNTKEDSPFKERIQEVGEPRKETHLVKDGQMIKYTTLILREKIFSGMYDDDVANLLVKYWNAVKEIYPNCFKNANEYVLLSTLGLSSLSRLFPTIYGYCAMDKDISQKNMKKYLLYLLENIPEIADADFSRPIDESWWHKTDGPGVIHGTGEGHYERIAANFAEKIGIVRKKRREK